MPAFVCDICEGVDNTATGHYWDRHHDYFGVPELVGKALCSECTPSTFKNGVPNEDGGKWHGRFPKRKATEEGVKSGYYINR